jgi:hypothetical protein
VARGAILVASTLALAPAALPEARYEVFPLPVRNPDDGPREVRVDPHLAGGEASPYGWHDTDGVPGAEHTIARGNNVHAYLDVDGDDEPDPGGSPDGGTGLIFEFPLDLDDDPAAYADASVTNAFYWANVVHDILYRAGFDEAAGNFQASTYGRGGVGGDAVRLEIQDGAFTNGGLVSVDPDGIPPRMELSRFTLTAPHRDGALSSFVLAYLHGRAMSLRLVGGPATTSCLGALESVTMSAGWGDWLALLLTARADDEASTPRTLGTYLFGQPLDGDGVRGHPYAADLAVNPLTYADLPDLDVPFGVGAVWATVLWEMTWALIDVHGFSPDPYAGPSSGGNVLALHLVVEAMKRVPCNPGFVDGRDALLDADVALTGGANCAFIWSAFARRGLGVGADQGSPQSLTDGIASFEDPEGEDCSVVTVAADDGASGPLLVATSPFRGQATLSLTTSEAGQVRVRVYDVTGRQLATLVDERLVAGTHRWDWTPTGPRTSSAAAVFVEVVMGERRTVRKLVQLPSDGR